MLAFDIKPPGTELAAALADKGGSIRFDTLDVRDEEMGRRPCGLRQGFRTAERPRQQCRRARKRQPVHEETVEAMRAAFDSNVLGIFLGMKTVSGMIDLGGGDRQCLVRLGLVGGGQQRRLPDIQGRGGDALQERRRHLCAEEYPHQLSVAGLRRYADVARRDPQRGQKC